MDNDGKVTDLIEQSKLVFLREALEEFKREQAQYDLGQEFAKSRRNRSALVPIIIATIVLLVGIGSWGVTWYIQQSTSNIKINIAAFSDVNLREVLDTAKRINTQITDATQRKIVLANEENGKLADINTAAAQQIALLQNENLSPAEINRQTAAIQQKADAQINGIKAEYAKQIDPINEQIQVLQTRAAQYDTRQVQEAKKQQQVLNSQQSAFDLQLQQQKTYYEERINTLTTNFDQQLAAQKKFHETYVAGLMNKYNPTFTDPAIVALLKTPIERKALTNPELSPYEPELGADGIIGAAAYANIQSKFADYERILKQLKSVPYQNSVPEAINQLEYRNIELLRNLQNVWQGLLALDQQQKKIMASQRQELATRRTELSQYGYAMESLVRSARENGYVIDPRNQDKIAVYIDKIRQVADGSTGYVFRKSDEFIGTIKFHVVDGKITASLEKLAKGQQLLPFDKILIQVPH